MTSTQRGAERSAAPGRPDRTERRARATTFGYFALNGFVLGIWVVHIPSVETRVGISHATLGWLLLLLGLGAFVGLQLVGPLTDRLGPRRVVPAAGVLCGMGLLGPAFATNAWGLGLALVALGFGNGCLDVSMNIHAVQVEARYGRPIMSAFHAVFSVGGFAAALVGARTLAWGWSPRATLPVVAGLAVVAAILGARTLLPTDNSSIRAEPALAKRNGRRPTPRHIWLLAALAFALMLTEGVANDWSTLAARDGLRVSASLAALTYGAFAGAMTVGRFVADRVSAARGAIAIVRYGSALAVVALAIVVASPWIGLTIFGWALLGIGLSGTIPQLFSSAGHFDSSASGSNVARVAGVGYLGMLAGPAVIGPLTHVVAIQHAFVLPLALCVVVVFCARAVAGSSRDSEAITMHGDELRDN